MCPICGADGQKKCFADEPAGASRLQKEIAKPQVREDPTLVPEQ